MNRARGCRVPGLALVLLLAFAAIGTGCQNSRFKGRAKTTSAQVEPADPGSSFTSAYLVSSPDSPYAPTTYVEAAVGDTVEFRWNGANADLINSYYTIDAPDTCSGTGTGTGPIAWVANTLTGSTTLSVLPCQLGRTYTYTYEATDTGTGKTSRALTVVKIPNAAATPPQGTMRANRVNAGNDDVGSPLGYIEVTPNETIKIAWDASGATATQAEVASDGTDTCGTAGLNLQEVSTVPASLVYRRIDPCMAGRIYTVLFKVTRPSSVGAIIESKLIIKVRSNPAWPAPTSFLRANNSGANIIEVTAGQPLSFQWGSTGADQGNSTITMSAEAGAIPCEDDAGRGALATSWVALGPKGEVPAFTVPDCKAKHTYTMTFTAIQTLTGRTSSSTLTLKVNPRPGT